MHCKKQKRVCLCATTTTILLLYFILFLFAVPTEFRECGLPQWIAQRPGWTTLDSGLTLQMTPESSRRFQIIDHHQKASSRMTCKKIVEGLALHDRKVKLVAYEKRGW